MLKQHIFTSLPPLMSVFFCCFHSCSVQDLIQAWQSIRHFPFLLPLGIPTGIIEFHVSFCCSNSCLLQSQSLTPVCSNWMFTLNYSRRRVINDVSWVHFAGYCRVGDFGLLIRKSVWSPRQQPTFANGEVSPYIKVFISCCGLTCGARVISVLSLRDVNNPCGPTPTTTTN